MEQITKTEEMKQRHRLYVLDQRFEALKLRLALSKFERDTDFQGFSFVESELQKLREKLNKIVDKPEDFAREFFAEDWED